MVAADRVAFPFLISDPWHIPSSSQSLLEAGAKLSCLAACVSCSLVDGVLKSKLGMGQSYATTIWTAGVSPCSVYQGNPFYGVTQIAPQPSTQLEAALWTLILPIGRHIRLWVMLRETPADRRFGKSLKTSLGWRTFQMHGSWLSFQADQLQTNARTCCLGFCDFAAVQSLCEPVRQHSPMAA